MVAFSQTSMFVPEPVISLALKPVGKESPNFSRALNRFQKEDPTFRVHIDHESKEVKFLVSCKFSRPDIVHTDNHLRYGRASPGYLC